MAGRIARGRGPFWSRMRRGTDPLPWNFYRRCWKSSRFLHPQSVERYSGRSWPPSLRQACGRRWDGSISWPRRRARSFPAATRRSIQPYETGVIASIHVQDGQTVKRGDVLIELDSTLNRADHERAFNEYRAAKMDAARLRALIKGQSTFEAPAGIDGAYAVLQQQLLRDQLAEYQARSEQHNILSINVKAALEQTRENILRLEATVPMEAERAEAYKKLLEHEAVTKMDFLQAEGQRIDKAQELAGQRKKLQQDRAALAEAEKHYRAMASEFQQTKQAELSLLKPKLRLSRKKSRRLDKRPVSQRLTRRSTASCSS